MCNYTSNKNIKDAEEFAKKIDLSSCLLCLILNCQCCKARDEEKDST